MMGSDADNSELVLSRVWREQKSYFGWALMQPQVLQGTCLVMRRLRHAMQIAGVWDEAQKESTAMKQRMAEAHLKREAEEDKAALEPDEVNLHRLQEAEAHAIVDGPLRRWYQCCPCGTVGDKAPRIGKDGRDLEVRRSCSIVGRAGASTKKHLYVYKYMYMCM